jgi:hypothetical protein
MGGTLCATPERWRMRPEARLGPSVPSSNFGLSRDGSPMTHRWTGWIRTLGPPATVELLRQVAGKRD